ncbi:MAG: DUF86 domain-containing protein [Aristaeellaceae bacterium]
MMNSKDHMLITKMIEYCNQIEQTVQRFGRDYTIYEADFIYRNACAMCIMQIGELVGKLSSEITEKYSTIPWRGIKATRNIFAHAYGDVDLKVTWETIQKDIPALKQNCQFIIQSETE